MSTIALDAPISVRQLQDYSTIVDQVLPVYVNPEKSRVITIVITFIIVIFIILLVIFILFGIISRKGKLNWKYILIAAIIVLVVLGIAIGVSWYQIDHMNKGLPSISSEVNKIFNADQNLQTKIAQDICLTNQLIFDTLEIDRAVDNNGHNLTNIDCSL